MDIYNYPKAIKGDVREYLAELVENGYIDLNDYINDRDGLEEKLNEDFCRVDRITGGGSGSYTFDPLQTEEYLCHNLDLLAEVCENSPSKMGELLLKDVDAADVKIRCYLLSEAISDVLNEYERDGKFGEHKREEKQHEKPSLDDLIHNAEMSKSMSIDVVEPDKSVDISR